MIGKKGTKRHTAVAMANL